MDARAVSKIGEGTTPQRLKNAHGCYFPNACPTNDNKPIIYCKLPRPSNNLAMQLVRGTLKTSLDAVCELRGLEKTEHITRFVWLSCRITTASQNNHNLPTRFQTTSFNTKDT
jgi:hypothetical protein